MDINIPSAETLEVRGRSNRSDFELVRSGTLSSFQLHAIFDSALDAILITDGTGRYTAVNPAAAELIGLPRQQIIGKSVSDFSVPDFDVVAAWKEFLREGKARGEFRLRRADGEIRDVEFAAVANIAADRHLSILRDITDAKRAAEALRQSSRRKDEFLAMLSHELRNPLNAIATAAEMLRSPELSASMRECSRSIIERQTSHLTRIVDDLLDASRITQGKIALRADRFDLASAVTLAREIANSIIQKRKQEVVSTLQADPLWVQGDVNRLAQVIANLLANAAKFSATGSTIWLSAVLEGGEAVVRVRDRGKGIPPDLLPHVFDIFVQEERSSDRAQGDGLGVGLALVRSLVELHGGQVQALSDGVGRGSEFVLRLPALAPKEVEAASTTP